MTDHCALQESNQHLLSRAEKRSDFPNNLCRRWLGYRTLLCRKDPCRLDESHDIQRGFWGQFIGREQIFKRDWLLQYVPALLCFDFPWCLFHHINCFGRSSLAQNSKPQIIAPVLRICRVEEDPGRRKSIHIIKALYQRPWGTYQDTIDMIATLFIRCIAFRPRQLNHLF